MVSNKPDVTIIIPAYNEEEAIAGVIDKTKHICRAYEIIVVDDGSTDNTYQLVKDSGVEVIRHPYNKGYGAALKTGIRNAKADIVMLMDADGQYQPADIHKLISYIGEYDMVVGARTKKSKGSLQRGLGKKILSIIANYLSGTKIPDLNCGFRAIKKSVAMEFEHILPNTFSFTTTITLACIKSGYNIKYVSLEAFERVGTSKIKFTRDGFNFILLMIRMIMLFDPLKVFLPVSTLLFIIGLPYLIYELALHQNVPTSSILLIISSILTFLFGLLADQVSSLRRELRHK